MWLGLTGPSPAQAAECADLLREKCQGCHALARTCDGLGRDQEGWRKSVARMAAYAPTITAGEQKNLVKCLAKQKKDVVDSAGREEPQAPPFLPVAEKGGKAEVTGK